MQFNKCKTCGAKDGRAGMLINGECLNCNKTRKTGKFTLDATLRRTDEEVAKTAYILEKKMKTLCTYCGNCGNVYHAVLINSMDAEDFNDFAARFEMGFKIKVVDKEDVGVLCSCGNIKPGAECK